MVIFDLDGTLYRGKSVLPGAVEAIQACRNLGMQIRFATNNSGVTQADIAEKLGSMGIVAEKDEVFTSAMVAGAYLRTSHQLRAFVVGEPALGETLAEYGVGILPRGIEDKADAVVVGICRLFDYAWMDEALQHLLAGATFIATNRDATYPLEGGRVQPGAGSIVASIAFASGREPVIMGKPNRLMLDFILEQTPPDEAVIVGDRLDTDIAWGKAAGCSTWLTLTGVTTELPEGQTGGKDLTEFVPWLTAR